MDVASAAVAQRFDKSDCVSACERLYYATRNAPLCEKQNMRRDTLKEVLEAGKKQRRRRCELQEERCSVSPKMMSARTEIEEDEECGRGTTPIASSGGRGINDSSGSGEGFSLTAVNKNNRRTAP